MKLAILLLLLLSACSFDTKKTGMLKNSQSIEESKRNGVFIQALKVINPIINIGNNKTDTITQMWLENEWTYESKYIFSTVIQKVLFLVHCNFTFQHFYFFSANTIIGIIRFKKLFSLIKLKSKKPSCLSIDHATWHFLQRVGVIKVK